MNGKNINFGDKKIRKRDFYKNKKLSKINDIDVNKILVSKKDPYGTKNSLKYFIGYNDNDIIDHYVWDFRKWLVMPENLMKMQQRLLK